MENTCGRSQKNRKIESHNQLYGPAICGHGNAGRASADRLTMSISVVICCHNGEKYLRETLDSVFAQTLPPLEVILVDDGSTDSSAEIARSYGETVRVISQSNCGLPASRNVGIQAARGEYLFFIDTDDLIHPTSFERLYGAVRSQRDTVAIMGFAVFRENDYEPISERLFDLDDFFPHIIQGNFGPQHNRLISKELALRAGCFDPKMYLYEDWLFWCRVAMCGARLAPVQFVGTYYRRHDATMSKNAPEMAPIRGHIRVMEELGERMLQQPQLLDQWGQQLFWSVWTALHRARKAKVDWGDLYRLRQVLRQLIARGPVDVRRSTYARVARWLGIPLAESLYNLLPRNTTSIG